MQSVWSRLFARDAGVPQQDSRVDVLDLVMHHAKGQIDQREVCALLCCSKPTADLTARHFKGQLHLIFQPKFLQHAEQFGRWLVVNGDLLQSVDLSGTPLVPKALQSAFRSNWLSRKQPKAPYPNSHDHDKLLRVSLAGADAYLVGVLLAQGVAATRAQKLQHLHSFVCNDSDIMVGALRQRLPTALTRLELTCGGYSNRWAPTGAGDNGACLAEGLAGMKALRSLKLTQPKWRHMTELQIPSNTFSPLTSLTSLQLCGFPVAAEHCPELPESLVRLECNTLDNIRGDCQLGHLTALTALDTPREWTSGDTLPPNLEVLTDKVVHLEVLQPLKRLRQLNCWMHVDELVDLARLTPPLTTLTNVFFSYNLAVDEFLPEDEEQGGADVCHDMGDGGFRSAVAVVNAEGVVEHICKLELEQTEISQGVWGPPLMQHLTALSSLMELGLMYMSLSAGGVDCLSSLTRLSRLCLAHSCLTTEALLRLPAALAQLPNLASLALPDRGVARAGLLEGASEQDRGDFFQGIVSLQPLRTLILHPFQDTLVQCEAEAMLAAATQLTSLIWGK